MVAMMAGNSVDWTVVDLAALKAVQLVGRLVGSSGLMKAAYSVVQMAVPTAGSMVDWWVVQLDEQMVESRVE